jgi:hypothetical protein
LHEKNHAVEKFYVLNINCYTLLIRSEEKKYERASTTYMQTVTRVLAYGGTYITFLMTSYNSQYLWGFMSIYYSVRKVSPLFL